MGLHRAPCLALRYGSQESEPQEFTVMPWGLPRAIICPSALLQPGLCPGKASSSQSSAFGQGQQCCTLAPCQEVLGNTPNRYLFWCVYHGQPLPLPKNGGSEILSTTLSHSWKERLPSICQLHSDSCAVPDTSWDPGEMKQSLVRFPASRLKKNIEANHCKTFNSWISLVFLDFFSLDS